MSAAHETTSHSLACAHLTIDVADRVLVRDLNMSIPRGAVTCVLGRNGAGKTLTLHTLAGVRPARSGEVMLDGQRLADWQRKDLAQTLGLLTQMTDDPFPSSVLETVLVGRHPHIGFWQWESERDNEVARDALRHVDMLDFETRDVATLSGGERRRVAIATLLAQNPALLLLDEPINHLDPHHQIAVLRLLHERSREGRTVLLTLHDATLAARYSDYALLLFGEGQWLFGKTNDVLTTETMSRLYGLRVQELAWSGGRAFVAAE